MKVPMFRNVMLLIPLVGAASGATITIPAHDDVMVCLPDPVNGITGLTVAESGRVTLLTTGMKSLEKDIGKNTATDLRADIMAAMEKYSPVPDAVMGKGYKSFSVTVGMKGQSISVNWAWNDKLGVPLAPDAKRIKDRIETFITSQQ